MRAATGVAWIIAAALLAGCSAPAARPAASRIVVDDRYHREKPRGDDVLVCTTEAQTGTHMKSRYCATQKARDQQRAANRAAAEDALNSGRPRSTHQPTAAALGTSGR